MALIVAGIGSGQASVDHCIELARRPHVQQAWRKCRHLVIDEISMVDGMFFEVRLSVYSCLPEICVMQCVVLSV